MKKFLILPMIFAFFFGFSQKESYPEIDSLSKRLKHLIGLELEQQQIETTKQKIETLCRLTKAYDGIDSSKTFRFGREALQTSKKINYKQGLAHANFMLGRALMYYDPQKAFEHFEEGKKIADSLLLQNAKKEIKEIWVSGTYNLALTHGYLGNHQQELQMTNTVIPVVKELKDSLFLANIHTNLGVKYTNLGDHRSAYVSLKEGRKIYRLLGDPKEVTFNQIQLAMALDGLDSLEQMKTVLDAAKSNLTKYPNEFDRFNYLVQNAQYHLKTKNFDRALFNLKKASDLLGEDIESIQYGMVQQRLARIHEAKKDYINASKNITNFIKNSKNRKNYLSIYKGYYKRAQYAAALDKHKKAYTDLSQAVSLYDSIETGQLKSNLRELEIKYATAEKERELLQLQNDKNIIDLELERQRSRNYLLISIMGSMAFLALTGYVFYNTKLRRARKKERVKEAELQLLKQEHQNKIFSALIEGQEKERKRLAIDLHDGLGGRLSGISLNLSKIDKDQPKEYPKKQLQKMRKDLDGSLQELRNIARNLMPETLAKFGLQAALKDYCSSITGNETKVTLQFYGTEKNIDLNQKVTIYRVIQELLNNAVKHAKATEILVQYIREGNQVDITVEDNGVGFSEEVTENENSGMGFSNLRTRVAYLRGELDVHSQKNEGTTVNVHINLDAA